MAKNLGNSRDKLASLKINTNIDLYDNKTPLSSNYHSKKPSLQGISSPNKTNFSSNFSANHVGQINQTQTPKNSLTQEIENRYKLNAAYAGYRSNSKNGSISASNTYNKDSVKLKEALDFDSNKYFIPGDTLSPKSTKNGAIKAFSSNLNSQTKYIPMSTRNMSSTSYVPGSVSSLLSTKKESDSQIENNQNSEVINVMSLLGAQNNSPITTKNLNAAIPNYDASKYSVKSMSVIKSYAANTHQGIVRTYNEDRVSIILNIIKPSTFSGETWPKCSFFGIYDGHGGASCADFLRDSLHQFIIKDQNFPSNVKEAIKKGFESAEKEFLTQYAQGKNGEVIDRSGSCAIVTLIVDNICYVVNVGDSRAILSIDSGKELKVLSNDHKPNDPSEKKRIIEGGGKVYQTQTPAKNFNLTLNNVSSNQILVGPHRVFPGRLSVSRTFGDVEAKVTKFGGLPNVITAIPEINSFEIKPNMDFVIMGCDGIFDQLSNSDVINCVWMTVKDNTKTKNVHVQSGIAVDMIIKTSLVRRTLDNVTCVMITFSNFEKIFQSGTDSIDQGFIGLSIKDQPNMQNNFSSEEKNKFNKNSSHQKYESFTGGSTNTYSNTVAPVNNSNFPSSSVSSNTGTSANLEMYRKDADNHYPNNMNITRKNYIQKKLVSLDLSSNTKKVGQFNSTLNKVEKLDTVQNSKSYYTNYGSNYNSNSNYNSPTQIFDYVPHQQHPSTTKHSQHKTSLMSAIKKNTSARGLGEK